MNRAAPNAKLCFKKKKKTKTYWLEFRNRSLLLHEKSLKTTYLIKDLNPDA